MAIVIHSLKQSVKEGTQRIECKAANISLVVSHTLDPIDTEELLGDGFVLISVVLALFNKKNLDVRVPVSRRFAHNMIHHIEPLLSTYFNKPTVEIKWGAVSRRAIDPRAVVASGISCGIDSLLCFHELFFNPQKQDDKIDLATFINAGAASNKEGSLTVFSNSTKFCQEANIPQVFIDTNFAQVLRLGHATVHIVRNLAAILCISNRIRKYYYGSGQPLPSLPRLDRQGRPAGKRNMLLEGLLVPALSNDLCEFELHGARYTRGEKIRLVSTNDWAQRYLHVCVASSKTNCGRCWKCKFVLYNLWFSGCHMSFRSRFVEKTFDDSVRKWNSLEERVTPAIWEGDQEFESKI